VILPTKHVPTEHSLIGLGALLLPKLAQPRTVTSLWEEVRGIEPVGTFDRFSLALDLLFSLGAIEWRRGQLRRRSP
jgi:hypothetical protein